MRDKDKSAWSKFRDSGGSHEEEILCPICGQKQLAIVKHTSPFYTYMHECNCGYIIIESEWELVDETEETL